MIKVPEFVDFRYSEPEWDQIKVVVPDALRHEFDKITRRSMERVVSAYLPRAAINRQRLDREELETLRDDAENLRARIDAALAVHLDIKSARGPHIIRYANPHPGVDRDMLDVTGDYFAKLASNLERQIKKAGRRTRRDSARKIERDELWTKLLVLWIDIGGKPTGTDAAKFLIAASKPVDADADASIKTVRKWLDRQKMTDAIKHAETMRSLVGSRK
jgi:hypothetical protein